ncbi:MAG: hypothetical protein JXR03_10875 [Cyclobacteriaceae bacterium]
MNHFKQTRFAQSLGLLLVVFIGIGCNEKEQKNTFEYDLNFIKAYTEPIILEENEGQSLLMLAPAYQGRILTSSASGMNGRSFGWINYDYLSQNTLKSGGNPIGGEDRFWLNPLSTKYSLFYKKEKEIAPENWFIPEPIDLLPFEVAEHSKNSATFVSNFNIENHIGTVFNVHVKRKIELFPFQKIEKFLGIKIPDQVDAVGFQSVNTLKNQGENWSLENGVITPWILGNFHGTPECISIIPFDQREASEPIANHYLNPLDSSRVKVVDSNIYFKTDGSYRSKVGLDSRHAKNVFGSYDPGSSTLTIIQYSLTSDSTYFNSYEGVPITQPYVGDAIDIYNNGGSSQGSHFYELESTAPARALKSGDSIQHHHRTYHFRGNEVSLSLISQPLLGCHISSVVYVLKKTEVN